jgi:diadenosine tetraphosphate (Ap4A) HIT family hydrolase
VDKMGEVCRFCDIIKGYIEGKENYPIRETQNYLSLASIGALVEGWVLIVPKEHTLSMKELYNKKDFVDFSNFMLDLIRNRYTGPFIAFEHGPNKCGSNTSCGTNHAHLHLVPYSNSLYADMLGTGLSWESCTTSQISSIAGTNEYLFYCEISTDSIWEDPKGFIHILKQPISQYFRRLIANQLNCLDEYDYKKYARIDLAVKTNNVLSGAIAC